MSCLVCLLVFWRVWIYAWLVVLFAQAACIYDASERAGSYECAFVLVCASVTRFTRDRKELLVSMSVRLSRLSHRRVCIYSRPPRYARCVTTVLRRILRRYGVLRLSHNVLFCGALIMLMLRHPFAQHASSNRVSDIRLLIVCPKRIKLSKQSMRPLSSHAVPLTALRLPHCVSFISRARSPGASR